jgi:segregation and condensation protein B
MDNLDLKSKIESILFVASRPLTVKYFTKLLEQQAFSIQAALDELINERKNSGVVVLENNGEYQLSTNAENSNIVKDFLNADLREKLTDATIEVLAIITYRQPISKAEIEAIRGVNSQYSLRHLLMRGLVEKIPNPQDARGFLYKTTTEFLQHLGILSVKDLPEFEKLVGHIQLPQTPALSGNESSESSEEDLKKSETSPETEQSTEKLSE